MEVMTQPIRHKLDLGVVGWVTQQTLQCGEGWKKWVMLQISEKRQAGREGLMVPGSLFGKRMGRSALGLWGWGEGKKLQDLLGGLS